MSVATAAPASPSPRRRWHAQFCAMLPQISTYARVAFRNLKPEARAEAVAEVVANACQAFARLVQLKKTSLAYPTVLARYGIKQTFDHRKVGNKLNVRDVLSPYCQARKGVTVERLDTLDTDGEWQEVLVEDRTAGPAEIVQTKLDFADFLKSLKRRDRKVAQFLAKGETTKAASKKFRVSEGRVSQLRRELAESWRQFIGDEPGEGAAIAA